MSPLVITGVYADPVAYDAQLAHGEFFVLENVTAGPVPLAGWWVRDAAGNGIALPANVILPPRSRTRVYTSWVGAELGDIALKRRSPFLNNKGGDTLELIDLGGSVRQRFVYP